MAPPAKTLARGRQSPIPLAVRGDRNYSPEMPLNARRHPQPARWTIAAAWMRGVHDLLQEAGLDAQALMRQAQLPCDVLAQADGRFDVERVDALWALAAQHSGQPHIALRRSSVDNPTSFDVLAYAMMSCRDLGEAIVRLVRYRGVVSDAVELRLTDLPYGQRIEVVPMEPAQPGRSQRLDYTIVTFLAFCRWVSCRRLVPLGVELSYPEPDDAALHLAAFGCMPRFDQPQHALLLRWEDLRMTLPTSNEVLSRLHDQVVQTHVKNLYPQRIEGRVATSLLQRIGQGRVSRRDVAADLCMSERTLQRRLLEAGTSFQQEVDTLRCQLAERYLAERQLPISGIPHLLGFAEESTFYRACQRWCGMSPGQWRDRLGLSLEPGAKAAAGADR